MVIATRPAELRSIERRNAVVRSLPDLNASETEKRICEVEGRLTVDHVECASCKILIGPGHLEERADHTGRCDTCVNEGIAVEDDGGQFAAWRRQDVLELINGGRGAREVAELLSTPYSTICADINWLQSKRLISASQVRPFLGRRAVGFARG